MPNNFFLVSAFLVFPKSTCVPCGGTTEFNCKTTFRYRMHDVVGGQLWRIQTPDGNVIAEPYSTNISSAGPLFEFIRSPHQNVYNGLRVINTNSTWDGTTFQCIAYATTNLGRRNHSAAPVTLRVGGWFTICVLHKFTHLEHFVTFSSHLSIEGSELRLLIGGHYMKT